MLFHMTFLPPYLHYSVIPSTHASSEKAEPTPRILAAPVPISSPKMMHDMAASRKHSVLLDVPLSLNPLNLAVGKPIINYDPSQRSRFGVLPRHAPDLVRWFEAPPCIIFHTAFASDVYDALDSSKVAAVELVCCRLNSPRLVYAAGNLDLPVAQALPAGAKEACELYYYSFPLSTPSATSPSYAFPLATIPFEFPTVPQDRVVGPAKYVYGCSIKHGNFDAALGGAAKIDCLVKVNVDALVRRGHKRAEAGEGDSERPVDERTVSEVLAQQTSRASDDDGDDVPIRILQMPPRHYAQESSFVPRRNPRSEDDGYLLTYVFDEHQLDEATGRPRDGATSELWVVDAYDLETVVAKVKLPQRGPCPSSLPSRSFLAHELTLPPLFLARSTLRPARQLVHVGRDPATARRRDRAQPTLDTVYPSHTALSLSVVPSVVEACSSHCSSILCASESWKIRASRANLPREHELRRRAAELGSRSSCLGARFPSTCSPRPEQSGARTASRAHAQHDHDSGGAGGRRRWW